MLAALALGIATAILWGSAALVSAPVSRMASPAAAFFWTSAAGTLIALPTALLTGWPSASRADAAYIAAAGVAYAGGTGLWLVALSRGRVSVIVPIVATDGAIAAALAALNGASLSSTVAFAMLWMVVGIVLVTAGGSSGDNDPLSAGRAAWPLPVTVLLGLGAAACFGTVFFASANATHVHALWVVAGARCIQLLIALPIVLLARNRALPRPAWRFTGVYGVLDVGAYVTFVIAAGLNAPVASVAASQYAAVAVLGGLLIYKERLRPAQALGIAVLLISIAAIAAVG